MLGKKERVRLESKDIWAIISLIGVIAIGILTRFVEGGLLGEELIYEILGGGERPDFLFSIGKFFAFIGSPKFLVPVIPIVVIISLILKRKYFAFGLGFSSIISLAFNQITKYVFSRVRPIEYMLDYESSFSYPSGHAAFNTCLYLFLAYYFSKGKNEKDKKIYYSVAIFFSLVMGLSRVYLGVHYFSDILGGFMSAYLMYYLTSIVMKKIGYTV